MKRLIEFLDVTATALLLDIPWNVAEATEVDETILAAIAVEAAWFLKRDLFLYGDAQEDKT